MLQLEGECYIGLLGCYPYTHLVFDIYLIPSLMNYSYYLLRVSICLHSLCVGWCTHKIKKHMLTTLRYISAIATCWGIWREHNNRIFRWCTRSLDPTFSHIISDILFWTSLASQETSNKARIFLGDPSTPTATTELEDFADEEEEIEDDDIDWEWFLSSRGRDFNHLAQHTYLMYYLLHKGALFATPVSMLVSSLYFFYVTLSTI